MRMPTTKVVVFNAAAVLITVAAVGAVARSLVFSPKAAPCSERYTHTTVMTLERAGALMTAADLQAGLGGRDVGLLENMSIVRVKDAPAPVAIMVRLPKAAATENGEPHGGVSFPWQPRPVRGRTAACLAYSVLLPADFPFTRVGGTLPGITGAEGDAGDDGFLARIVWRQAGRLGIASSARLAGSESRRVDEGSEGAELARGRWVRLEQEVVLNTPRKEDGILRLWIDGWLAIDRRDVSFRARPEVTISGVAADVFYGAEPGAGGPPKDTKVSLTPLEIRWH